MKISTTVKIPNGKDNVNGEMPIEFSDVNLKDNLLTFKINDDLNLVFAIDMVQLAIVQQAFADEQDRCEGCSCKED